MKTKLKVNEIILILFVVASAIFLFLSLFFPVVTVSVDSTSLLISDGKEKINAFQIIRGDLLLLLPNHFLIWTNTLTITVISVFSVEIVLILYRFIKKIEGKGLLTAFIVINLFLTATCMVNGFVAADKVDKSFSAYLEEELGELSIAVGYTFEIFSLSFIGCIISGLFTIGYFLFAYLPNAQKQSQRSEQQNQGNHTLEVANSTISEEQTTELLIKYKQLLDQGVITQEEYDKKKASLLEKSY